MIIILLIFFTVLFLTLFFIKNQDSLRDVETDDSLEPGLTELDYVPEEEIKKKKASKKNPVQHYIHPQVKKQK